MPSTAFDRLVVCLRDNSHLEAVSSLLDWDQETLLPPKGITPRSSQRALLAGILHERKTCSEMRDLLAELRGTIEDLSTDQQVVVREFGRTLDRAVKVPKDLVEEMTRLESQSVAAWATARKEDRFADFVPFLEKIIALKRECAEAVGYEEHLYDAFLDEFEPGTRTTQITPVLEKLCAGLVPILRSITERERPDLSRFSQSFPVAAQRRFGEQVLAAIGFDFTRGRTDESTHPFCSGLHPDDVRLTTRFEENDFRSSLFSYIHEGGHGLYEQGLDSARLGTAFSLWASMGIHESQSRLWENIVGRGRAFWTHFLPLAKECFPSQLEGCSVDELLQCVNDVQCSTIRVEADELSYNLHIGLRFELEQALLSDALAVNDLPGAWNEKMQSYLGVQPATDREGCLQDIHWSMGLFGYFPTYSLGNLYAAMLWRQIASARPDIETAIERGEFAPLLAWLRENIYLHGRSLAATELVHNATGETLSDDAFLDYIGTKYGILNGG